jgi:ATP-binding cassette subfamily F protein 3
MLSVEQLTLEFGGRPLFDKISFLINEKDKIALVGKNGAGKTTILRLLAGEMVPNGGNIVKPKDFSIGYLPQHLAVTNTKSVFDETFSIFQNIFELEKNIEKLTNELAVRTDCENADYYKIIEKLDLKNEHLRMLGKENLLAATEKILLGLGFISTDFSRNTAEFSGGWRMRIELAKILLQSPDLLLLDEPTNHLDIESILWLENFLANSQSAVIVVSHDKRFLDNAANRTIEISLGKIYDYKVGYTKYLEIREEQREQQLRAYENQQKMIADTQDFIERFRYKPTKAAQVQSRIKQLAKIQLIEVDAMDNSNLNIKFPPAPHSGTLSVDIEELTKSYGKNMILENISLQIRRGEKIAFVGKNGEGKTTLVKCIMGRVDFFGKLQLGHNVKIGYFAQNQALLLDEQKSIFQTIDEAATGEIRTQICNILGAFLFGGENTNKKVAVLSGGERSRLAMIQLLLEPVNMLILDEPTNHLDITSKNILKEALKSYNGTAIIVSHDREFLNGLVTKVYEFSNKKIVEHFGGIDDFLHKKKLSELQKINLHNKSQKVDNQKILENKLNYEEQKEQQKQQRKREKQIVQTEHYIQQLEQEIFEMEKKFAEGVANEETIVEYQKIKRLLEQKIYEWEILLN